MLKKSINRLYKKLSTKKSITFKGIPIINNYKPHLKLYSTKNFRSKLRSNLYNKPLLLYRHLLPPNNY